MRVWIDNNIKDVTELEQIAAAAMKMLEKIVTVAHSSSQPFITEIENGKPKDLETLRRYNLSVRQVVIH